MRFVRSSAVAGIPAIVFLICSGCTMAGTKDANVSQWKHYSNEESGFQLIYPVGWEVIDEGFYKTHYGLTIKRIGGEQDSNDWIRVNSPQFSEEDGMCATVSDQQICTYSKDSAVIDILHAISASFVSRHE